MAFIFKVEKNVRHTRHVRMFFELLNREIVETFILCTRKCLH